MGCDRAAKRQPEQFIGVTSTVTTAGHINTPHIVPVWDMVCVKYRKLTVLFLTLTVTGKLTENISSGTAWERDFLGDCGQSNQITI